MDISTRDAHLLTPPERWARDLEAWSDAVADAQRVDVAIPAALAADAEHAMLLVAEALAAPGAPHQVVVAWFRENLPGFFFVDDAEITAELALRLAIENNPLAEAAARLEELVRLGPEELERRRRAAEYERTRVSRRMRRWCEANLEPKAPPPWERDKPGYRREFENWWRWTQEHNRRWSEVRRRVVADLCRPRRTARPVTRCRTSRRRPRWRRRARAPARPGEDDPSPRQAVSRASVRGGGT